MPGRPALPCSQLPRLAAALSIHLLPLRSVTPSALPSGCCTASAWPLLSWKAPRLSLTPQLHLLLAKADDSWWRALLEGDDEKSFYEVLQEAVHAGEF